ncbi:MAG: DUF3892 domain-containing protein [Eubacteriaceae bacterium]|nr:DUF3892 domain-containing protein [Eubacteriaceae bacterium]
MKSTKASPKSSSTTTTKAQSKTQESTSKTQRQAASTTNKQSATVKQTAKQQVSNPPATGKVSRSMNTLTAIPKQNASAKKITALVKRSGKTTGYQFADGTVMNKPDAIKLAKKGGIQGVGIAKRNGSEYLKTLPDGSVKTNLTKLPTVTL